MRTYCDTLIITIVIIIMGFPGESVVKNLPASAGDFSLIPGLGRLPGGRNGNPVQYSRLENSMDRGAWQATVHGAAKSWTQLKQPSTHACTREALYLNID